MKKRVLRSEPFAQGAIARYLPTGALVRVHKDDANREAVRVIFESEPAWIVDYVAWWNLELIGGAK